MSKEYLNLNDKETLLLTLLALSYKSTGKMPTQDEIENGAKKLNISLSDKMKTILNEKFTELHLV